jgi:polyisoprenoid-binding protein YceI
MKAGGQATGVLVPADALGALTGRREIDPSHSAVTATVSYARFTLITARFSDFDGTVVIDGENPSASFAEVTIRSACFESGMPMRDGHSAGPEFLDASVHPEITYRSESVASSGGPAEGLRLDGRLTLRGVSRPQSFDVEFHGAGPDMMGNTRAGSTITGGSPGARSAWTGTRPSAAVGSCFRTSFECPAR